MPIQEQNVLQHTQWPLRQQISQVLSDLHLRLDEAWLTGADRERLQHTIEMVECEHAALLCPCHLCAKPTIFLDAAYDLPFCWTCLQDRYHRWYRSVRYHRA